MEYRDLLAELLGFVSRITKICQPELIGFGNWIGHFLPGIAAPGSGFTKMKNEGQRQYQQITVFKTGTSLAYHG